MPDFFGYGLMVDLHRMREACGDWRRCDLALLPRHRLLFRIPDAVVGLREDAAQDASADVHGLLYEVEEQQLDQIGRAEPLYRWDTAMVVVAGERRRSWVLRGRAPAPAGKPSPMYLARLVWAYGQHALPPEAKAALVRAASP